MCSLSYTIHFRFCSLGTLLMVCTSCNPIGSRLAAEHDEYTFAPNALLVGQNDKTLIVCIKRHGDVYSYRERHGSATKVMESTYYLESYDAENMRRIAQRKIDLDSDEMKRPPQIIGKDTDRIWIFTDQLTAYRASTLEMVVNRENMKGKNPGLKDRLLNEEKYYWWDSENKVINITAADGTTWQLNTQTLTASPYTASSADKAAANKRNRKEYLWRTGSERAFISSQDTVGDTFYGLYSVEELPVYAGTFRNDAAGSADAVRSLWFTSFNSGDTKIIIDRDSLKSSSDQQYINGFFLVSRHTSRVFHCADPSGFIIAYKTAIGKNGLVNFARVATNGKAVWNIETDIKEIKGLDFTDSYMLIQASDNDQNNFINKIYSIRLADGKVSEAGA